MCILKCALLVGGHGSLNPVNEFGHPCVDARLHGIGTTQTPGCHTLDDKSTLSVADERATAVALHRENTHN